MKVSELGEFGLIELLSQTTQRHQHAASPAWKNLVVGIGDDAAAWQTDAPLELVTVDSFIEDIHFTRELTPWHELGWKALTVNLSDIAAMGGVARYAVVSLAVPPETEVSDLTTLYEGMAELADETGVAIIGGDMSRSPQVAINITVIGNGGHGREVMTRSGARIGDRIAVSGRVGGAGAGWEILRNHQHHDEAAATRLVELFQRPQPRLAAGQQLLRDGIHCAIDISDGMVNDLGHICDASGLSARLEIDRLPLYEEAKQIFGERARDLALSAGEDYELLFTGPEATIHQAAARTDCEITIIGEMIPAASDRVSLVNHQGRPYRIACGGWEHFSGQ